MRPAAPTPEAKRIVRLYAAGWSLAEIAAEVHRTKLTVRRALIEQGVTLRSGGWPPGRPRKEEAQAEPPGPVDPSQRAVVDPPLGYPVTPMDDEP